MVLGCENKCVTVRTSCGTDAVITVNVLLQLRPAYHRHHHHVGALLLSSIIQSPHWLHNGALTADNSYLRWNNGRYFRWNESARMKQRETNRVAAESFPSTALLNPSTLTFTHRHPELHSADREHPPRAAGVCLCVEVRFLPLWV